MGTVCGVSAHDSQTKRAHTQILGDLLSVSCSIYKVTVMDVWNFTVLIQVHYGIVS